MEIWTKHNKSKNKKNEEKTQDENITASIRIWSPTIH